MVKVYALRSFAKEYCEKEIAKLQGSHSMLLDCVQQTIS